MWRKSVDGKYMYNDGSSITMNGMTYINPQPSIMLANGWEWFQDSSERQRMLSDELTEKQKEFLEAIQNYFIENGPDEMRRIAEEYKQLNEGLD